MEESQQSKGNLNKYLDIGIGILLILGVIYLQFAGYYNRVYIAVVTCDGRPVQIEQTTEMKWNNYKQQIEQFNAVGTYLLSSNSTGENLWE